MRTRPRPKLRAVLAASCVSLCLLLAAPPAALAQAPGEQRHPVEHAFAIGFDLVIVRPLRTIAVVVGAAFFVPAAIVTSPSGTDSIAHAWDKLVGHPSEQAFQRPLGDL